MSNVQARIRADEKQTDGGCPCGGGKRLHGNTGMCLTMIVPCCWKKVVLLEGGGGGEELLVVSRAIAVS